MPVRRGKRIALITGAVAVLALVGAVVASWGRLREEWYIRQLSSPDQATRHHAANMLGAMGSVRAVPALIRLIKQEPGYGVSRPWPNEEGRKQFKMGPVHHAVFRIGPAALPALLEAKAEFPALEGLIAALKVRDRNPIITIQVSPKYIAPPK